MSLFGRSKPRRVVARSLAHSDLVSSEQKSSPFLTGRLHLQSGVPAAESVVSPYGSIVDVGFAAGWAAPLSRSPPRDMRFCQNSYSDRFFYVTAGDCGNALARVAINEQLVEDTYMRGSIDFTGFEVIVTFAPDAYRLFAEFVDIDNPRDYRDARGFVLSVPTQPFPFPAQRGSPSPGDARIEYAKKLRPIKRLDVQELVVAVVTTRTNGPAAEASVVERFEILAAMKLSFAHD